MSTSPCPYVYVCANHILTLLLCDVLTGPSTPLRSKPCPIRNSETLRTPLEMLDCWQATSSSVLNLHVSSWPQRSSGTLTLCLVCFINIKFMVLITFEELLDDLLLPSFRSMLYNGSEVIRDLEWVIFDEVHYINDAEVRNSFHISDSSNWL